MEGIDVCLVHPPSIYDFRTKELRLGPISDVVPSTPVFEMYPIGFVSMLAYLVKHGHRARIANLAVQMLSNPKFDAEAYLKKIDARVFGIDLHWLPHVHGAYHISKMIKRIHPDAKVVLGGFSATYFSAEIMKEWPWVDYVLYGDYQEEPLLKLAEAVEAGRDLSSIPNLVYRNQSGEVKRTALERSTEGMKRVFIDYKELMRNTIRYHDVKGHMPYYSWIKNPEGFTLIEHGCQFSCGFCGGSKFAYGGRYGPISPAFRDPATVALEIELVQETIGAPVFVSGDMYSAGPKYYNALFSEIKNRGIDLPLLTEYFTPPNAEYFNKLSRIFPDFSAEISPDSSAESIRHINGRNYTNAALENSISEAKKAGCKKFDVYFMIGLSGQRQSDVMADADYASYLIKKYNSKDMSMDAFIAPLAPFVDPGSLFFEMPDKYGIKLRARHLMEFYNLLDKGMSWEDHLNYETNAMSRKDIVRSTYLAGMRMVKAEAANGKIDNVTAASLIKGIRDYMDGKFDVGTADGSEHLTYLSKQIEWSKKHRITLPSVGVHAYKFYDLVLRKLRGT
ncbi:MAG: TIGR04190 family B12-binding domain/radical SAM domain protein [Candidatus Marsarchaeota archaeon]|jgi:B12-binding domain/radical SAM domain protein|nr:TIGR04190 family B12-binding domain/radical SAM domain protein [Candidatus Marsarchaeota archaeon]